MKFSTREDVNAPAEVVFAAVSDFDAFQTNIARRGATVKRTDTLDAPGTGMAWDVAFKFRGRQREAQIQLVEFDPPQKLRFNSQTGGLDAELHIDVISIAPNKSRVMIQLELRPRTLSARLIVQSMKLAKSSLTSKFKQRVAAYAGRIEQDYRAAA